MSEEKSMVKMGIGESGIQISTLDDAKRFATYVAESGLAPKGIQTPAAIITAMQMGFEIGLKPMQALQNIAVINGRPSVWGDAALGLVRASGELEKFVEKYVMQESKSKKDNGGYTAVCIIRRKGDEEDTIEKFSIDDAHTAGLWGKAGPWTTHPKRMLRYKARNFALRDKFTDVLKGLKITEDLMDEEGVIDITEDVEGAGKAKTTAVSVEASLDEPGAVLESGENVKKDTRPTDEKAKEAQKKAEAAAKKKAKADAVAKAKAEAEKAEKKEEKKEASITDPAPKASESGDDDDDVNPLAADGDGVDLVDL